MDNVDRIRIGFFAPDFVLKDSEGKKIGLSDFRGEKNLFLFFGHGKRCEFCLNWLDELNRFYDRFQLKQTEILALSPDARWISGRIKVERKIQFSIVRIEDDLRYDGQTPAVTQLYSVEANQLEEKSLYLAVFIVDKRGIVRFRKIYHHPSEKPDLQELLCELEKLS